jgi:dihydroorotate dehydrogenase
MNLMYRAVRPILMAMDAERAHHLALWRLRWPWPLTRRTPPADPALLETVLWGRRFANPVGLAAGFDKDAVAIAALWGLGFGFVEAGTTTPRPQPGNERPRLWRAPGLGGVINCFGFNNAGVEAFASNLARARGQGQGIVGANVGRNKDAEDAVADYVLGIRRLAPLADYLTVNVSSPNTPGLRALQAADALPALLRACLAARDACPARPPLLLKIAPDLSDEDKADIVQACLDAGIDGLIVANTTLARPPTLPEELARLPGGLSGRPLMTPSTRLLADFARALGGRLPLIGVGGISSGADAYAKIRAGANLTQLYSALVYEGPDLISRIKHDLALRLAADGFSNVAQAVGVDL